MSRIDDMIRQMCPSGVPYRRLGELARIRNGRDFKHLGSGPVPVYGSGGVMRYVSEAVYDHPSVLIPRKGSLNTYFTWYVPFLDGREYNFFSPKSGKNSMLDTFTTT